LGAIITEVAGYIWLFGSTISYYIIEPIVDFLATAGALTVAAGAIVGFASSLSLLANAGFIKTIIDDITDFLGITHYSSQQKAKRANDAQTQLSDPLISIMGNFTKDPAGTMEQLGVRMGKDFLTGWEKIFSSIGGNMYNWGKNLLGNFVSGIEASIPGLSNVLQDIANYFPHSPPTKGPLSTITAMNMKNWISGIMSAGSGAFNSGLSNLSGIGNTIGSTASSTFNSISHGPIQIDASQMSPDELMAMMTYICEKYLLPGESTLPTGPSATKTSSSNKTTPTPTEGILPTLPTIGGSGIVPTV
jgi:hypothetical protein